MKPFTTFTAILFAASAAYANTQTGLTDAQIYHIVRSGNNGEVESAKLAKKKSTTPEVKTFASQMVEDHSAANRKLDAVMVKAQINPEKTDQSKTIEDNAKATEKKLKSLTGAEFDKAYADAQVSAHQQTLERIDRELIPNAHSPSMKEFLAKTRETVTAHLDHAKNLQSNLH